jgi:hypothetical protein
MKRWLSNMYKLFREVGLKIDDTSMVMWYMLHKNYYDTIRITPYTEYGQDLIRADILLGRYTVMLIPLEILFLLPLRTLPLLLVSLAILFICRDMDKIIKAHNIKFWLAPICYFKNYC